LAVGRVDRLTGINEVGLTGSLVSMKDMPALEFFALLRLQKIEKCIIRDQSV